jgi:hypothetical protein
VCVFFFFSLKFLSQNYNTLKGKLTVMKKQCLVNGVSAPSHQGRRRRRRARGAGRGRGSSRPSERRRPHALRSLSRSPPRRAAGARSPRPPGLHAPRPAEPLACSSTSKLRCSPGKKWGD